MTSNIQKINTSILLVVFSLIGFTKTSLIAVADPTNNINKPKLDISLSTTTDNNSFIVDDFYFIGPGDILELTIYEAPGFSGSYQVLSDGSVNLPLIGRQVVRYLTLDMASTLIEKNYSTQLLRPELHLKVITPRPINVSLYGEVERPGIYSLTRNESSLLEGAPMIRNNGEPRIIDAIQKAGGITQYTDLQEVVLTRRLPGKESKYKRTSINLLELILNGNHDHNVFLFDGDIIELKKADPIPDKVMQIAQTNLSAKEINVNIIGKVLNPGTRKVDFNTPLTQAILMAGGPLQWKANNGNVELIRINKNGSVLRTKYEINLDYGVSNENNPPLKDNDIVIVNPSLLNIASTGLGAAIEPITPVITALSLFKLLN